MKKPSEWIAERARKLKIEYDWDFSDCKYEAILDYLDSNHLTQEE